MTFKFDPKGHQTSAAFCRYEEPEQEAVTGSRMFAVVGKRGKVLFRGTGDEVAAHVSDLYGGRVRVRDGLNAIFTIPEKVMIALKANGQIDTQQQLLDVVDKCLPAVLKAVGRHTVAQTTRRGKKVYLPVEPLFIVAYPRNTRVNGRRLEGGMNVFMLGKGWDRRGRRYRSIDLKKAMFAQAEAQAAGNAQLGYTLRDKGILVLPHGKSVTAFGVAKARLQQPAAAATKPLRPRRQKAHQQHAQPQLKTQANGVARSQSKVGSTAQPNANGAARQRKTAAKPRVAKLPNAGPAARKRAAKANSRATPKQVVTFREAWEALVGVVKASITQKGIGLLTSLDKKAQSRMTRAAIKEAFRYHRRAGFARFSETSVKAFAMQLTTPHVRPDVFDKVWKKATQKPSRFGANEVKVYPNGYRMFAPTEQLGAEGRVTDRLIGIRRSNVRGLGTGEVLGSLLRHNVGGDIADVLEMCRDGGLRWASQYAPNALKFAAHAYTANNRRVHVVGDPSVGKQLKTSAFSAAGFLDSATRTPHLRALWLGLRERGPFGDWLGAAQEIRRAKPRVRVQKGDMVVIAPGNGLEDARAMEAVLKFCERKGAKVVMAGAGAEAYRAMTRQRGIHP